MNTHQKLVSALLKYDERESKKRFYNTHAMAIYLGALDEVENEVSKGISIRKAILNHFCGARMLNTRFAAIGEPKANDQESR